MQQKQKTQQSTTKNMALITNKELLERLRHKDRFKGMKIIVVDSSEFEDRIKKQKKKYQ